MNNFNNSLQNQWNQPYYNPQHFTYPSNQQQYQTSQTSNQNGLYQNSYPNFNQQNQPQSNAQSDSILKYNAHDLDPYNNQQFLCKTFNYKVQYIQAFLALPSQLKLKFYMSLQEARLYGEIKDREGYQTILQKIAIAVKILQGKPLTEAQKNSQKPKSMEDKINQLCDYEFSKLHISDHQSKTQAQEEQFQNYVSSIEVNYANGSEQNQKTDDIFASLDINGGNRSIQQKKIFFQDLSMKQNTDSQQNKKTEDQEDQFGAFNDCSNNKDELIKNHQTQQETRKFYPSQAVSNLLDEASNLNANNNAPQSYIPSFDELYPNNKKIDPFNVERPKFAWMQKLDEQETFKMGIFDLDLDDDNPNSRKSIKEDRNKPIFGMQSLFQTKSEASPLDLYKDPTQTNLIVKNNQTDQDQDFQDFAGGDNEKAQLVKQNEASESCQITIKNTEQPIIDFKSAYQTYQSQFSTRNAEKQPQLTQSIFQFQKDTNKFQQNTINTPQKQPYKSNKDIEDQNILDFQQVKISYHSPKQVQQSKLIVDDYDIMWASSLQASLPVNTVNTNQIYEDGSLIQVDAPSSSSNKNNVQQNSPKKKITDQMEMIQVQEQEQWQEAVQQNQGQQKPVEVQQQQKSPKKSHSISYQQRTLENSNNLNFQQKAQESPQFVEVRHEMSHSMNYQQSKPMKKIKKPDNVKIQIPQYQFGDSKVQEQQGRSKTEKNQGLQIQANSSVHKDTKQIDVVLSPRNRQFKLQKVSSNLNICIGVQEMTSPRNSERMQEAQISRKSSSIANDYDIQSSVDQNYLQGSQNMYAQSQFDAKCEMSQISSPKYRMQNDMNKTHAFPVQRASNKINQQSPAVETHPLLKPLVLDFSTKNIIIQLRNNSFQCNAEFYLETINWLQKLQFKNNELYNHLQQQLATVQKIKQLTELYTKAVEQDEEDKLMEALQQSKKQYKLLNSQKTKNLINYYIKRGNRSLYYDLCAFLIQSGNVSIQFIQKQLPTRTSDTFPHVVLALYVMQKNNLIQSIPIYSAKLNTYILRQYQVYRQTCDNLKTMEYQQQQKILKSQKYRIYMIGLGTIAMICKRTCTLGKMSSKSMGSLVKVLKICKDLETQAVEYLKQHSKEGKQKSLQQLWTQQANQKIIPNAYCQYTLKQLKMHRPANQIQTGLDRLLISIPICKLCLGTQNLCQKQGLKIHAQCWNLYRTVNSQIQEQ